MIRQMLCLWVGAMGLLFLSACSHHHLSVPSISGVINHYAAVTSIDDCSEVTVEDASRFATGDLVMVIQMQGASINGTNTSSYGTVTDNASAGLYEFGRVQWVAGNTLQLQNRLLNHYSIPGKVQVVYVPEYKDVSIDGLLSCAPWNGKTGGVLTFKASGMLNFNADINVDGKGFRGGTVHEQSTIVPNYEGAFVGTDLQKYSYKGEGIAGFGIEPLTLGRGAPANGGGGGGNHNAGGGGGANGGCGGNGGWAYRHSRYSGDYKIAQGLGGHVLAQENGRLFLGGGGGAGHSNNSTSSDGGNGGAVVYIQAAKIIGKNHTIYARGQETPTADYDGTSGAGAGGTVALCTSIAHEGLNVNVNGGKGGNTNDAIENKDVGAGGGGGGGVVWFSGPVLPPGPININVLGGQNGSSLLGIYGTTPGCDGIVRFNLVVPVSNERCDPNDDVKTPPPGSSGLSSVFPGFGTDQVSSR